MKEDVRKLIVKTINEKVDLITADGGIDNDAAPQLTEQNSSHLLAAEILLAFDLQNEGGTFIVKVFGLRYHITLQLIAILSHVYEEVSIINPFTSRSVNDERYVVCKGFRSKNVLKFLISENEKIRNLCSLSEAFLNEITNISVNFANTQLLSLKAALEYETDQNGRGKGGKGKGGKGKWGRGKGGRGTPY